MVDCRKKKADKEAKGQTDKPDKSTGNVAVVERDDSEAELSWVLTVTADTRVDPVEEGILMLDGGSDEHCA